MSNLHRIQWIDAQIQAKHFPNSRLISEHFEISLRQASRDIEYLRYSLGAPVEYSAQRNGYFYSDAAFTLPPFYMSEEEKKMLVYLADQYSAMKSTQASRLAELFSRLTGTDLLCAKASSSLPVYDVSRKAIDVHNALREAIASHCTVEMRYLKPNLDETSRLFNPYKIFIKNRNRYVVGFCMLRNDIRIFRVDRILVLQFTKNKFTISPYYHENEYEDETPFDFRAPYTCVIHADRPIHFGSLNAALEENEAFQYTVEFLNSEELLQTLLSQSHSFSILSPNWLKEKLKERLQKLFDQND